jgi:integrase/recombinase XerC
VARKIKAIPPDQIIPDEEMRILIEGCRSRRISMIMWLLSVSGLRISELTSLRLDRIQKVNGASAVVSITGKGRKERKIFLPVAKIQDAQDLFQGRVYLIETLDHKRYCRKYLWREINAEGRRILGRPIHPHMFRHSWATDKISEKKLSIKAVSLYLGHSNVSTTSEFYHHDQLAFADLFGQQDHAHVAS